MTTLDDHVLADLTGPLRVEIDQLIAADGVAAGLNHLIALNRIERNAAYDIAIRNLRVVEGIARQPHDPDAAFSLDGPEVALDRTSDDIPFVEQHHLSVDAIRAGIRQSGCLLVKGLLTEPHIMELRAEVDAAIAASPAGEAGPDATSAFHLNPTTAGRTVRGRIRRKYPEDQMRLAVDAPHALFSLLELYRSIGLLDIIEAHLGSRLSLAAEKTTLRRVLPEGNLHTGWHQDGAFLEGGYRVLNVWLALSDCGVDAPGLEVLPQRLDDVLPGDPAWKDSPMPWIISDQQVEALAAQGAHNCRPRFDAGDALLFDGTFLHRTGRTEDMTNVRYAIEAWFFDQSTVPTLNLPVLV